MKYLESFMKTKTFLVLLILVLMFIGILLLGFDIKKETVVALYYPNTKLATASGFSDPVCDPLSVVYSVYRKIPTTSSPIRDTINLLLKGEITNGEKKDGFNSEFPNKNFKLKDLNLSESGELTLVFDDPDNFSTGGSCRVGMLAVQIINTAKQFSGVKSVRILPESIFQP